MRYKPDIGLDRRSDRVVPLSKGPNGCSLLLLFWAECPVNKTLRYLVAYSFYSLIIDINASDVTVYLLFN